MSRTVQLTKAEIDALKDFADDNLAVGLVENTQSPTCIGIVTKVQVEDLPETLTDIIDYDSW